MRISALVLLLGSLLPTLVHAENVIDVVGVRRESRTLDRPGRSESITPEQSSRFQLDQHLKERSAFDAESNGRISASGFLLPRTRGQGAKATSVFLGDLQLYDPLTGFPLIEDLDLRAFGRFSLHRGISPAHLPTTNPIGSIVLVPRLPYEDRNGLGVTYGQPSGTSGYALIDRAWEKAGARLYWRSHQTSGRYRFFNDNGTPANSKDDGELEREDNFTTSQQVVPIFRYDQDGRSWRFVGIYTRGQRGVPSLGGRTTTGASTRSASFLQAASYTYTTHGPVWMPATLGMTGHYRHEERKTMDPRRTIFVTRDQQSQNVFSGGMMVPLTWDWRGGSLWTHLSQGIADGGTTNVQTTDFFRLGRRYEQIHIGFRQKIYNHIITEAKASWRRRMDQGEHEMQSQEDKGSSLNLGWQTRDAMLYAQIAREERPPGLFEQYGDGGSLLPNPTLRAETVLHREVGFSWKPFFSLTYFDDRTDQKMVFIPSFANAFKAVNLQTTRIRGLETAANYEWASVRVALGWSRLRPEDLSTPNKTTPIPRIPRDIINASFLWSGKGWTFRSLAKYRGIAYADILEQSIIPPTTIHELSLDWQIEGNFSCSGHLYNLTDVKSASYDVPGTGERGRRARSELSGYPLPGRTFQTGCDLRF